MTETETVTDLIRRAIETAEAVRHRCSPPLAGAQTREVDALSARPTPRPVRRAGALPER